MSVANYIIEKRPLKTPLPRIPWGLAKQIVAGMNIGQTVIVRPNYVVAFHNAARRLGMRVRSVAFEKRGELLFSVQRVGNNAPSGHTLSRWPERDPITGHWRKDAA